MATINGLTKIGGKGGVSIGKFINDNSLPIRLPFSGTNIKFTTMKVDGVDVTGRDYQLADGKTYTRDSITKILKEKV